MAGRNITGSRRFAFRQVQMHEGQTCRELESRTSSEGEAIKRGAIQKRLPFLVKAEVIEQGAKRTCEVTGRLAITWWTV